MEVQHITERELVSIPKVQKNSSDDLAILLINARSMMSMRDYKTAEQLIMRILSMDSHHVMALEWIYQIHLHRRNFSHCVVIAKNILKLRYDFQACLRLAKLHYQRGEDQQALDRYFEALAILNTESMELFEIYKNIGNIYTRFGDFDAAEEYFNKAHVINPDSDVLRVNFGTLALQKGDPEKAKHCFQRAVQLNQSNSQAWIGLAMIHHQQSDFELAWANMCQGFDFDPQNKTALQLICQWSLSMNKHEEAIKWCLLYLDRNEFDQEVSGWLVEQFAVCNKFGSALLEAEKIRSFCPELQMKLNQLVHYLEDQCTQRVQWA